MIATESALARLVGEPLASVAVWLIDLLHGPGVHRLGGADAPLHVNFRQENSPCSAKLRRASRPVTKAGAGGYARGRR